MSPHRQTHPAHQRVECFVILAAERPPCSMLNPVDLFPEESSAEEPRPYLNLW